jgi:hypothetical protein
MGLDCDLNKGVSQQLHNLVASIVKAQNMAQKDATLTSIVQKIAASLIGPNGRSAPQHVAMARHGGIAQTGRQQGMAEQSAWVICQRSRHAQ